LMAPMEIYREQVADWTTGSEDVVMIVDTRDIKFAEWDAQRYFWQIMSEGYALRIVNRTIGQGVPIAPEGTRFISLYDGGTVPRVAQREIGRVGYAWETDVEVFQTTVLTPGQLPEFGFAPSEPLCFANGACVTGAYLEGEISAGEILPLTLVWEPRLSQPDAEYQFSVRLVDPGETSYGQRDFRSLDRIHWREGETVINPTEVAVSNLYLDEVPLRLQVIMYRFDNTAAVDLVDAAGNPVAPWLFLDPVE
jgi:hypothetical protein